MPAGFHHGLLGNGAGARRRRRRGASYHHASALRSSSPCIRFSDNWGDRLKLNYAIVFVSDMKRSTAFYRDVLGLPLRFESPGWTEFATDGATLALHSTAGSATPEEREHAPAGRCRPGLMVPNLAEFHQRMVQHGVTCLQEPKDMRGAKIARYADPDGLSLSVSEERRA